MARFCLAIVSFYVVYNKRNTNKQPFEICYDYVCLYNLLNHVLYIRI